MSSHNVTETCRHLGFEVDHLGIIVVDHGSRREDSNRALEEVVRLFQSSMRYRLVAAAHMEIAEPSLEQAFDHLVRQGAQFIVVHPYFLLPGRHWAEDIPALARAAAAKHPTIGHLVTAPLGVHALMGQIMDTRIQDCLRHLAGEASSCALCPPRGLCTEPGQPSDHFPSG